MGAEAISYSEPHSYLYLGTGATDVLVQHQHTMYAAVLSEITSGSPFAIM